MQKYGFLRSSASFFVLFRLKISNYIPKCRAVFAFPCLVMLFWFIRQMRIFETENGRLTGFTILVGGAPWNARHPVRVTLAKARIR